MKEKVYNIEYLPLAISDLFSIEEYITLELKAPLAAINLIEKLEKSILNLERFPFSGSSYKGNGQFDFEYRMLLVENYIVFYIVLENTVEIHRIICAKRNLKELL